MSETELVETPRHVGGSSSGRRFRGDIEGLRAVAVVAIVAYHAGIPGFSGGFVGVDIFFVISGYLITANLLAEVSDRGRIDFRQFWARRIRRLVPGLALMVVVVLVAGSLAYPPFDMLEISKEAAASSLYVSNILFGLHAQNYFASSINKSPYLHTWSLGVEEQFYLVWPLLVVVIAVVNRSSRRVRARTAPWMFALVIGASFVLNVRWTDSGSVWAFFSLPTRAWEFAVGGLLASISVAATTPRVKALAAAVGCLGVVYATVRFTDMTPYPGIHAAVPVIGTALIIFSGEPSHVAPATPVARLLGLRPMRWTGRLSYSWYLWHWPFIVITVLITNNDGVPTRAMAAAASLVVASLAFRLVENPFRLDPALRRSPRRTYVAGAVITLVALGFAGGTWYVATTRTPSSFAQAQSAAFKNFFPVCASGVTEEGLRYCAGGDLHSPTVVALVGDSHAATWFNATSEVATTLHVRLAGYFVPGCPFIPVRVRPLPNGPVDESQCLAARQRGLRLLAELKPKVVVLTQHEGQYLGLIVDGNGSPLTARQQTAAWQGALRQWLGETRSLGATPAVILDNPTLPYQPAECVSDRGSIAACEPSRAAALSTAQSLVAADRRALAGARPPVPVFSPDAVLCDQTGCPLALGGHLLYADTNHLLFGATRRMIPDVERLLKQALATNHR